MRCRGALFSESVASTGASIWGLALAVNANATSGKAPPSVSMVYLPGGLNPADAFDMQSAALREARGPFQPMSTRVSRLSTQRCSHSA